MKKILSLALALALCLGLAAPAVAVEVDDTHLDIDVQNKILQVLAAAEQEKENYGLQDVDFNAVSIGHEIPAYRVQNGKLVDADLRILPVIVGETMVSLLYVIQNPEEETYVQLSNSLVTQIYQYLKDGDPFAIIYDDEGAYIYTTNALFLLGKGNSEGVEKSNLISRVGPQELQNIVMSTVQAKLSLNVDAYMQTVGVCRTTQAHYLPVEIIQQPDDTNICWAIACTAIINYVKKTSYTYQDIVDTVTGGVDKGLDTVAAMQALQNHYGLNYVPKNGTSINKDFALEQLLAGYPIFGAFEVYTGFTPGPNQPTGVGHAVVIRGINLLTNTFSIMNPTPTTTGYTMGSFSSGTWKYVCEFSGKTYELRTYGNHK